MIYFKDRLDAYNKLLGQIPLEQLKKERWLVLAISEGGVYFADKMAEQFKIESDYLFTHAVYAPNNKECTIAMISETEELVINEPLANSFGITLDYIYGEAKRMYEEKILSFVYKYRKGEMIKNITGQNVLLIDEGADTGMTLMASLKTVFALHANKVAVALPIVPESIAVELNTLVDDVYFVHQVKNYVDVYSYYQELPAIDVLSYGKILNKYCRLDYQ